MTQQSLDLPARTVGGRAQDDLTGSAPPVDPVRYLLTFDVHGVVGAQGSKRHVGNGRMIESSKKVAPWRQDVVAAASTAIDDWRSGWLNDHWTPLDGCLHIRMVFTFTRPQSHYRTGRNAHLLKADAPVQPNGTPDLDKCARSTCDALKTAGLIRDDARIVEFDRLAKVWAGEDPEALDTPGCRIAIRQVTG